MLFSLLDQFACTNMGQFKCTHQHTFQYSSCVHASAFPSRERREKEHTQGCSASHLAVKTENVPAGKSRQCGRECELLIPSYLPAWWQNSVSCFVLSWKGKLSPWVRAAWGCPLPPERVSAPILVGRALPSGVDECSHKTHIWHGWVLPSGMRECSHLEWASAPIQSRRMLPSGMGECSHLEWASAPIWSGQVLPSGVGECSHLERRVLQSSAGQRPLVPQSCSSWWFRASESLHAPKNYWGHQRVWLLWITSADIYQCRNQHWDLKLLIKRKNTCFMCTYTTHF